MTPGLVAVMRREVRRACASAYYPVLMLLLPLLSFAVLIVIFRSGVPRDLPIAVVDGDHTALSRQVTRMVDATPSMRVAHQATDMQQARSLILEGRAYAVLVIPADMERDVRRGEAPKLVAYYNAQFMLPAGLIRRDLRAAVGTASAGLEVRARQARGDTPRGALAHFEPIRLDSHTLFNPQLNYLYFLVTALLPTMLQIFVTVATVHVLGSELRHSTAGEWLAAAGGSTWRAVAGKLLPYTVHFGLLALFMLALLFRGLGMRFQGSLQVTAAATLLFVVAYQAAGVLLVALFANLRLATSGAAFYCTPAFAFVGITFPLAAMPALGRAWGDFLPLTHYLRVLVDQGLRGTPAAASMPMLGVLLAFCVLAPLAAAPRMARIVSDPRYWGRL